MKSFVFGLILGAPLIAACLSLPATAQTPSVQVLRRESLSLPSPTRTGEVELRLSVGGRAFRFELDDHPDLRGRVPAGVRVLVGADRDPGTWARLSHFAGGWHGVLFDGTTLWLVEPSPRDAAVDAGAAGRSKPGATDLYRVEDLLLPDLLIDHGGLAVPASGAVQRDGSALIDHLPATIAAASARLPITLVADRAFQTTLGGNAQAALLNMFNVVDGIFDNQVGIGLQLQHIELLSDDANLIDVDMSDLLRSFGTFMVEGVGAGIPVSGNVHLFTGRSFTSAGIAWVGALCNRRFGQGVNRLLSSPTVSALVFAHELGHNFGAPHDGASDSACQAAAPGLMAPTVGSTDRFSQCSIDQMQSQIAQAFCLVAAPAIVAEDFNGNWFNPIRDGEGVQVSVEGDGSTFVLSYYTYLAGRQVWMIGAARPAPEGESRTLVFDLVQTDGADFGARFDPARVVRRTWGRVELTLDASDCNHAQLRVVPSLPEFGAAFTVSVERIVPRPNCG